MYLCGGLRTCLIAGALALGGCDGSGSSQAAAVAPAPAPVPVQRTVVFDANGATAPAPAAMTFTVGQAVQLPAGNIAPPGYGFTGWNSKADGTGVAYAAQAAASLGSEDLTLYAQFKLNPIKVTQQGGDGEMRLLVEWPDGSQQDIVYTPDLVGFGIGYDFTGVVGGLAVLIDGGERYVHTCYPADYRRDGQAVMTVTDGGATLLRASGPRLADRQGALALPSAGVSADELKVVVRGRLVDSDADTEVEITLRADAPRMVLARAKIAYTRPVKIERLYQQGIHANPRRFWGAPFELLYGKEGDVMHAAALDSDVSGGVFYTSDPGYYVGFIAPRAGAKDFAAWRRGDYFAAYKIVYDDREVQAGDVTESRSVSTFGFYTSEARTYLQWAESLRRGDKLDPAKMALGQRGAARAIAELFTAQ